MIDERLEREQLILIHVFGRSCNRGRPRRRAGYMDCQGEMRVNKKYGQTFSLTIGNLK